MSSLKPRSVKNYTGMESEELFGDEMINFDICGTVFKELFRPCPHVSGNFFFRKYFFADTKIYASTRSVFESFSAVHTYPIVSGNFLICSSAQFFCRRES